MLISPRSIGEADCALQVLPATITKEQVKHSPEIDTDKSISRQYERSYMGYYGYPYYWGGAGLWGERNYPGTMVTGMGPSTIVGIYEPRKLIPTRIRICAVAMR